MLILSRKVGEDLVVGESRIRVLSSVGDRVRLGITAPFEVPIRRGEVPADLSVAAPLEDSPVRLCNAG